MVHVCFKAGLPGQERLGHNSQHHDAQFKLIFCVQAPNDRGELLREQDLGLPSQQLQCHVLVLVQALYGGKMLKASMIWRFT